jgi:protein SCO1/2
MAAAAPLLGPSARAATTRAGRAPGAAPNRLPDVLLQTHEGRDVHFYNDLVKGRLVVLNMMYANCANICPPNTANLLRVRQALGSRIGRDVFMYSLTLQPAIDKPADLRRYMDKYGIDGGWTFLTGQPRRRTVALQAGVL